jgi:hypothetical protein
MIGLGMEADAPAVPIQLPLADGVHLRWSFRRDLGFPWWGYFLFRRPSDEGRRVCLSTCASAVSPSLALYPACPAQGAHAPAISVDYRLIDKR